MRQTSLSIVILTSLLAASACTPQAKAPTVAPINVEGTVRAVKKTAFSGLVSVPSRIISDNTAGIISDNTAGVVGDRGGNVISNNSSGLGAQAALYAVLAGEAQSPVAGATVRLVDQEGKQVAGVTPATTDATGSYTLKNVPTGSNWLVVVEAPKLRLSTVVRPSLTSKPVPVTVASTVVTEYLRRSFTSEKVGLQHVDPERVALLSERVAATIADKKLAIDVSSQAGASDTFLAVAGAEPGIADEGRQIVNDIETAVRAEPAEPGETGSRLDPARAVARIDTYVADKPLGKPWDAGFGAAPAKWNGLTVLFFEGADGAGRSVVVDGPSGPALISGEAYDAYIAAGAWKVLGAPSAERRALTETSKVEGVTFTPPAWVQTFERGELRWSASTGTRRFPGNASVERASVTVDTVAGDGTEGPPGHFMAALAVDAEGLVLAVENKAQRVHKINALKSQATVMSRGGTPLEFSSIAAAALDATGNFFWSDWRINAIHKATKDGMASRLAGTSGQFDYVEGALDVGQVSKVSAMAFGPDGTLYIADVGHHSIRKVSPEGVIANFVGNGAAGFVDGVGQAARFNTPQGLAVDASGTVYVADSNNHRVRRIAPDGTVTTVAGDGTLGTNDGAEGRFSSPLSLALTPSGDLLVTEFGSHAVRLVSMGTGAVSTIAGHVTETGGADGEGLAARFDGPNGLAVDRKKGLVYMTESGGKRLRVLRFN